MSKTSALGRLQRRLGHLLSLAPEQAALEPLLAASRPGWEAFRQEGLPGALAGLSSASADAVVGALEAFLLGIYGKGTILDRAPLGTRRPLGGVELSWPRDGERYARSHALGPCFLHPGLEEALAQRFQPLMAGFSLSRAEAGAGARLTLEVQALAQLGRELCARLGAVEAQRVALWEEERRVSTQRWCASLSSLPPALAAELSELPPLWTEWRSLGAALPEDPTERRAFVAAHPHLPVDTGLLTSAQEGALREGLEAGDTLRGLVVEADNAHGLRWLRSRFAGQVQCAYLDPPFNTTREAFLYEDNLPSGAWLSFMQERLALCAELLGPTATLYAHIDHHEKERLRLLLDRHLHHVAEIVWRIGWLSGFKTRAKKFIRNHDTIYQYGACKKPFFEKRYLPYPEGYRRRDGKRPTGKGIPLEDTWNCSAHDRLDSVQIVSFSKEKVGCKNLTQKNEALLERMLLASSRPDDLVLDPFLGSGTTAAVAHKLGRRWLGIDLAPSLNYALPRLKRVLAGDPYGISRAQGWEGGGAFEVLRLETHAEALGALALAEAGNPGG